MEIYDILGIVENRLSQIDYPVTAGRSRTAVYVVYPGELLEQQYGNLTYLSSLEEKFENRLVYDGDFNVTMERLKKFNAGKTEKPKVVKTEKPKVVKPSFGEYKTKIVEDDGMNEMERAIAEARARLLRGKHEVPKPVKVEPVVEKKEPKLEEVTTKVVEPVKTEEGFEADQPEKVEEPVVELNLAKLVEELSQVKERVSTLEESIRRHLNKTTTTLLTGTLQPVLIPEEVVGESEQVTTQDNPVEDKLDREETLEFSPTIDVLRAKKVEIDSRIKTARQAGDLELVAELRKQRRKIRTSIAKALLGGEDDAETSEE